MAHPQKNDNAMARAIFHCFEWRIGTATVMDGESMFDRD